MNLASLRLQSAYVLATIVMFAALLALNEWLFARLEFVPGINWVYLPAGLRLLCPLLFAEAGAVGLLLVSWGVSFGYLFPGQFERAFWGGLLATAAPYGVYCAARHAWGLEASLAHLTSRRLLLLCGLPRRSCATRDRSSALTECSRHSRSGSVGDFACAGGRKGVSPDP